MVHQFGSQLVQAKKHIPQNACGHNYEHWPIRYCKRCQRSFALSNVTSKNKTKQKALCNVNALYPACVGKHFRQLLVVSYLL